MAKVLIDAGKGFAFDREAIVGLIPAGSALFAEDIPEGATCAVELSTGAMYPYYFDAEELYKALTTTPQPLMPKGW